MRAPISWISEFVDLPDLKPRQIGDGLVRVGLEVEQVSDAAAELTGPIVVGRVLSFVDEPQKNGKSIRWCQVDVGAELNGGADARGIVCGASNFAEGDLVVVALPGAVLPGGFAISARKTYGHTSDGMICSTRELGIGDDHAGILVLPADSAKPGENALDVLGLRDAVLDIAVTPDRGYCLSVRGLAREASVAFDAPFRDLEVAVPEADGQAYPVTVSDPGCALFSARAITGLNPAAPVPAFIAQRLRAAGMRSISLAVDVTNYVMIETGQPLHAFDRSKLTGALGVRRAQPGERLVTLDGVTRTLDPDDMLVTDESGPIALAGVMGGASTEIDDKSTDVVLEAAHWDPASVGRTVRRHKLPSEAAKRFERGVDPEIAKVALQRCVDLLVEYGGATAVPGFTVVGDGLEPLVIPLPVSRPAAVAGMPIPDEVVRARLEQVGCTVEGTVHLLVTPPSWRPDLTDPADLVEEVIRLEGYDKLPSVLPTPPAGRGLTEEQRLRRTVSRSLAAAGYTEVLSYPFVSPTVHDAMGLPADDARRNAVRLANPLSDAEPEMRTSLLPGLFANVNRNVGRGNREIAVYEIGLVYLPSDKDVDVVRPGVEHRPSQRELEHIFAAIPAQPRHVAVALAGDAERAGWWGPARPASWADAIEAARVVARAARVELDVRPAAIAPFHPGRCAELFLAGESVGVAGELHPRVVENLGLPPRTCAMELNLDAVIPPEPAQTPRISAYPPVLLDVALVVKSDVASADLESAVRDGAGDLLESIRLFDVYSDAERLGPGLKSLAFSLKFRADDRTLTVEEATAARDAAIAVAAERTGATLRA